MARQILYLHWKAIRLGLLPLVIAAFGLPLLTIQGLARPEGLTEVGSEDPPYNSISKLTSSDLQGRVFRPARGRKSSDIISTYF